MSIVLKYAEHSGRLGNIAFLVRFTMGAIDRLEQNLPKEESYIKAKEKIVEAFHMIVESLVDPPQVDSKKIGADVDKALIAAQPSRNLIHNLCLVMLVTQTEIFIEHLVDVILSTDSRRLKDLAGEKNLTTVELVDLQDYGAVMKRLREKVSKEITASSTQDMFIKHLGKRFGLFRKEDLVFKRPHAPGKKQWDIDDIESVWTTRHKIVHEGELLAGKTFFDDTFGGCVWLETFLSFQAREKYGLTIDSPDYLNSMAKITGISKVGIVERIASAVEKIVPN